MHFIALLLLFVLSCAAGNPQLAPAAFDVKAEVDMFLSAHTPEDENKILDRLRARAVTHAEIKSVLRELAAANRNGPPGLFTGREIAVNGGTYSYALFVPGSGKPAETTYPLAVVLHGAGETGDAAVARWVERLHGEFIVVCPTYPAGAWWTRNAEALVLGLIQKIRGEYPADPGRVLLIGLSNGAVGAYMIGMFNPDVFAGIVPIAGAVTERYMHFLVNLNNTPVYMIQGRDDPIFPAGFSRRIYRILADMRYPAVYREHTERGAHGGHFLPETETPALYEWLKRQTRPRSPVTVRMTREQNHLGQIQWARVGEGVDLAALQLPGPEEEPLITRDGKIATLIATRKDNNRFEVMAQNLLEYEIYLNDETTNFDTPVLITTQQIEEAGDRLTAGERYESFSGKVEKDMGVLLRGYKARRDPGLLFDAKVSVFFPGSAVKAEASITDLQ